MMDDSQSNDDADFLDEYFAIDESIGTYEDLDDLFDGQDCPQATTATNMAVDQKAGKPEEPYQLFQAESEDSAAADDFQQPILSDSDSDSSHWDSDVRDLGSNNIPGMVEPDEQGLTNELASLMSDDHQNDSIDQDAELATDAPTEESDYGVIEFEQSGPFILDDGEGLWTEDLTDDANQDEAFDETANIDLILDTHEEALMSLNETPSTNASRTDIATPAIEGTDFIPEIDASLDDLFFLEDEALTLESAAEEYAADTASTSHEFESNEPLSFLDDAADELPPAVDEDLCETMSLMPTSPITDDASSEQAGWEPLPAKSMDELSEIDGLERIDAAATERATFDQGEVEEHGHADYEPAEDLTNAEYDDEDYEDAEYDDDDYGEEEDLYSEVEEATDDSVIYPPAKGRRPTRVLVSIAASLVVIFGAGAVAVAPELIGLTSSSNEVATIEVPRPTIEIGVTEPPPLLLQDPVIQGSTTIANANQSNQDLPGDNSETGNLIANSGEAATRAASSQMQQIPTKDQELRNSATTDNASSLTSPRAVMAGASAETNSGETSTPSAATTDDLISATAPGQDQGMQLAVGNPDIRDDKAWPIGVAGPSSSTTNSKKQLTRFGESLLVGGIVNGTQSTSAIDGVMPGSRALAQLHNGNYFVGQVKRIAETAITLRIDTGELTIEKQEIAQITPLGTDDYEQLQQASKGFVRLTNNNRLIGGILSRIADDHVVLEFRKNRVMLPKSEIGEIVAGEQKDVAVRLGTTDEEDSWVRNLAKRQLGTGKAHINSATGRDSTQPLRSTRSR